MVNIRNSSQIPLRGQLPEDPPLQNQRQQQPEDTIVPDYNAMQVENVSNTSHTTSSLAFAATPQLLRMRLSNKILLNKLQLPIQTFASCKPRAMQERIRRMQLIEERIKRMQLNEERIRRMQLRIENLIRNDPDSIQANAGSIHLLSGGETLAEDSASLMAQGSAFFDPHELFLRFIHYIYYLFCPQHEDHQHLSASSNAPVSSSSNPETEQVRSSVEIEETFQGKSSIEREETLQVIICEICADTKRITQMIKNQTCHHSYCSDCMTKHVAAKIQDGIIAVPCPGLDCKSVFEFEACRPWLPKDIIERWDKALCEALFLQVPKFYCPFKDCSAMMLVENEEDQQAEETECPVCHRMFCSRCNIPWHVGVNCKEYQKLNENERQREDLLMRKLAKEKRWRRCPKCKFYVEKITGCVHITCRCKYEFCYACGKEWNSIRGCC